MKEKRKFFKSIILSSLVVNSIFLFGNIVAAKDLTKGTIATPEILNSYYPKFKVGSKWIYNSKTTANNMIFNDFDLTSQIIKETKDTFTIKTTGSGRNFQEIIKKKDFSPIGSENSSLINYKYQGKDNIKTISGLYSVADKFTANDVSIWFVKGKGPVKSEAKSSEGGMKINSTVSLKSFTY